jgi:oxygen-independent coproporphyrinogen-3 oxidase
MTDHALYLHFPFCRHRCAYCDFNTYAGLDNLIEPYLHALTREIEQVADSFQGGICSIFLGGGTPSLVPIPLLNPLMRAIRRGFSLSPQAEITLEANPGTVSLAYLSGLRELGVNRLSMGMQSASPEDLRILERAHAFADVVNAVCWARQAGFDNVSVDLIFGVPHQTLPGWQHTLELALGLGTQHLSVYNLILEHGTPMLAWVERGLLPEPDADLSADMYEHALARLAAAGYVHYEISNWARRDAAGGLLASRHNLQYWRNLPYFGLGAGAHGYAAGVRTVNVRAPAAYIERMAGRAAPEFPRTPATINAAPVTPAEDMGVHMMMGLRLVQEGVSAAAFAARFGEKLDTVFHAEISELVALGLLAWHGDALKLTRRGVMLGNRVFMQFV